MFGHEFCVLTLSSMAPAYLIQGVFGAGHNRHMRLRLNNSFSEFIEVSTY